MTALNETLLSGALELAPVYGTSTAWGINAAGGVGGVFNEAITQVASGPSYANVSVSPWTIVPYISVFSAQSELAVNGDYQSWAVYSNAGAYALGMVDYATATFSTVALSGLPGGVTPSKSIGPRASDKAFILYGSDGNFYAANSTTGVCSAASGFPTGVAYTSTLSLTTSFDGAWGAIYTVSSSSWSWGGAPLAAQQALSNALTTLLAQSNVVANDQYLGAYNGAGPTTLVIASGAKNAYINAGSTSLVQSTSAYPSGSQAAAAGYTYVTTAVGMAGRSAVLSYVGHNSSTGLYSSDVYYAVAAPVGGTMALPTFTLSGSGGTSAVLTIPAFTLAGAGNTGAQSALSTSLSLPSPALSAVGNTPQPAYSVTLAMSALSLGGSGTTGVAGVGTLAVPAFTLAGYGQPTSALTLAIPTLRGTGTTGIASRVATLTTPAFSLVGVGSTPSVGYAALKVATYAIVGSGVSGGAGRVSAAIPAFALAASGMPGRVGIATMSLQIDRSLTTGWSGGLCAYGAQSQSGVAAAQMRNPYLQASGYQIKLYVLNTGGC